MKKRIDWIDIAKGIAIILVVYGHTTLPVIISKAIYSFHMPLFFILSGLLSNPHKITNVKTFIIGKVHTIVIPYFFFLGVDIVYRYFWNLEINWYDISFGHIDNAYWFLQVFFVTVVWNALLVKYLRSILYVFIILMLYGISYYMSWCDIHLPYRLEVVGLSSLFWCTGYYLKQYIKDIEWNLLYCILGIFLTIVTAQVLPRFDMNSNQHGTFVLNYLLACWGTTSVIMLSKRINKADRLPVTNKVLLWCGTNTIVIMGLSQPLNMSVKFILSSLNLPKIISFGIQHALLWILLVFLAYMLNKYLPVLIGKKRKI